MAWNLDKLLASPSEAILSAKRRTNAAEAIGTLVISSIIAAIAVVVAVYQIPALGALFSLLGVSAVAVIGVAIFLAVFVAGLVAAFLVNIIANTLGGRGNYLCGLGTISYSLFAPSLGFLIAAIFLGIPYIGIVVSFLAGAVGTALGVSTLYRCIRELYNTDTITAFVAVSVLTVSLVAGFYLALGGGLLNLGGLSAGLPLSG